MEENVSRFNTIFSECVRREGSDNLLEWLTKSDFFTAPASTRFHGSYEGGLLEHSLNVYDCLTKLLSTFGLSDVYTKETVAIVSLLHDICKVNFYKKGFRNVKEDGRWIQKEVFEIDEKFPIGHGEKSVIILQNFIKLSSEEIMSIRAHMGGFDDAVKGGAFFVTKIYEKSKLATLLHLADMAATHLMEGV